MFEEDVPSVLELEMEEMGQWIKKDGKCLQTQKADKINSAQLPK